ncbi:hypothetical protein MRX96_048420 [Rhipicephalus microplus]
MIMLFCDDVPRASTRNARHRTLVTRCLGQRSLTHAVAANTGAGQHDEFVESSLEASTPRRVKGSFVAPKIEQKLPLQRRVRYFALNVIIICVTDMPMLAVDPLRLGPSYDSHICVGRRI